MELINLLQNQPKLLSFSPLIDYLQEIENSNAEVIFQDNRSCYLENEQYYYKIEYHLSSPPLSSQSIQIGQTDKNFLPLRYTTFTIRNWEIDVEKFSKGKYINDNFLVYQDNLATGTEKEYFYTNDEIQELSNRSMTLSLQEMNQLFHPEECFDSFERGILKSLEQSIDDNHDAITALCIKIDYCASGREFMRLSMGPFRHRFTSQPIDEKPHIRLLKR